MGNRKSQKPGPASDAFVQRGARGKGQGNRTWGQGRSPTRSKKLREAKEAGRVRVGDQPQKRVRRDVCFRCGSKKNLSTQGVGDRNVNSRKVCGGCVGIRDDAMHELGVKLNKHLEARMERFRANQGKATQSDRSKKPKAGKRKRRK